MSELPRSSFTHDGLTFSYLDSGGNKPPFVMLHAHWMGGSDFEPIFDAFTRDWRVIALDQRGHGFTDHTHKHGPNEYVGDVTALLRHLGIEAPITLLGHSFGGQVAYLFAAAHPVRVRALVIEEMNVARDDNDTFVLEWAGVFETREALEAKIGARLAPYLAKSIKEVTGGYTLRWEPKELIASEHALNGNHWKKWLASTCPALVIAGADSVVVPRPDLEEMAQRRPNTEITVIEKAGHSVHIDRPIDVITAVTRFLAKVTS